jgi:hypothetical protein
VNIAKLVGPLFAIFVIQNTAQAVEWPELTVGGIVQPGVKWEQQDPSVKEAAPRNSGFFLSHARAIILGTYHFSRIDFEGRLEAELNPGFTLLDAYLAARGELRGNGFWRLTLGQHFAPFSRQTILSVADLQFVNPAQLVSLTPGRQLGISGTLAMPYAPWVQLSAGVFNGKGINVVENLDKNFMYVGRLAFRPWAPRAKLMESALGEDAIWVAADIVSSKRALDVTYNENDLLVGTDAFVSWRGLSAYVEYFWGNITYTLVPPATMLPKQNYKEQGFNAQAGYLLPIPGYLYRKLEVTFRYEAIAPNQTVPITAPGDPTQARESWVAGLNYYFRGHDIKLMLNYYHNAQIDDKLATGASATFHDDSFLAQVTFRMWL